MTSYIKFHVGTVSGSMITPNVFEQCYEKVSDVVEHFRHAAKDIQEEKANEHNATCEHCQADLANGVQPDCLGMDESTDASVMLAEIADGDFAAFLSRIGDGGGSEYKIGLWVRACIEFEHEECRETVLSR